MTRVLILTLILAGLAVALVPTAATADSYPNGYVNDAGYTWNNGYWWKDHAAYKYEKYWVAGGTYYQNGCYYNSPGYWAYKYVAYPVAAYTPPKVTAADPDWRSKLLDIAGNRDKVEGDIRKKAFEQKWFNESVQALGLTGNFHWDGYGAAPPYPAGGYGAAAGHGYGAAIPLNGLYTHNSTFTLGNYGVTGSTVYGSSYKQLADLYGDSNLPQLYQQANRLAENAQRLSGQATSEFSGLVKEEGSNKARVAQILARAEAVKAFLSGIDGPPSQTSETRTLELKAEAASGAGGQPETARLTAPAPEPRKALFESVFKAECAACHTGSTAKGGYTLQKHYEMSAAEKKKRVWPRLQTDDKDLLMPRTKDGGPGTPLPLAKAVLFAEF